MAKLQPALHGDGLLVLWGSIDIGAVNEAELNDWWTYEHLPERLCLPGFIRARRYHGELDGDRNRAYLALYEASRLHDLSSEQYLAALNQPTARTASFMPTLAKMNRSACSVVGSTAKMADKRFARALTGNWLATVVFFPPDANDAGSLAEKDAVREITDVFGLRALSFAHAVGFSLVRQDDQATHVGRCSESYAGVRFDNDDRSASVGENKYIALIELAIPGTEAEAKASAVRAVESLIQQMASRGIIRVKWNVYQLLCSMSADEIREN